MFGIHVGSKERDIVFPAEVCYVTSGELYKKKVPQELTHFALGSFFFQLKASTGQSLLYYQWSTL